MNVNEKIDKEEFEKLLYLLKEYTLKLREICEHRADFQYRMIQGIGISITMIAALFSAIFFIFEKFSVSSIKIIFLFPLVMIALAINFFSINRNRFRDSFDADRMAASVERLTMLASQYAEHSPNRISDRFELDLRIAEAEGTLRYYKRLFRTKVDWTSKD